MPRGPRLPARPVGHRLSPRESSEVRRSEAVLWPWVSRVSARAPATVDAAAFRSCTFTVDLHERSHSSEANTWQMYVPGPCGACQVPMRADPSISSMLFGLHETDPLRFCWSEFVPVFLWVFFFFYTSDVGSADDDLVTDEHS